MIGFVGSVFFEGSEVSGVGGELDIFLRCYVLYNAFEVFVLFVGDVMYDEFCFGVLKMWSVLCVFWYV